MFLGLGEGKREQELVPSEQETVNGRSGYAGSADWQHHSTTRGTIRELWQGRGKRNKAYF